MVDYDASYDLMWPGHPPWPPMNPPIQKCWNGDPSAVIFSVFFEAMETVQFDDLPLKSDAIFHSYAILCT